MTMMKALRNVANALFQLEQTLRRDEPLRREAKAIREALTDRVTSLKALRKHTQEQRRKMKPKPMLIELFIPQYEDIEGFEVELDVSNEKGLQSWQWWRDVWNGTA